MKRETVYESQEITVSFDGDDLLAPLGGASNGGDSGVENDSSSSLSDSETTPPRPRSMAATSNVLVGVRRSSSTASYNSEISQSDIGTLNVFSRSGDNVDDVSVQPSVTQNIIRLDSHLGDSTNDDYNEVSGDTEEETSSYKTHSPSSSYRISDPIESVHMPDIGNQNNSIHTNEKRTDDINTSDKDVKPDEIFEAKGETLDSTSVQKHNVTFANRAEIIKRDSYVSLEDYETQF